MAKKEKKSCGNCYWFDNEGAHFKILKELGIELPQARSYSITQLLRYNDRFFAFFDDSVRAEKSNPDFKEITIGEYEDLINSYNEQKH